VAFRVRVGRLDEYRDPDVKGRQDCLPQMSTKCNIALATLAE
jgi:hypothetical protein